MIVVRDGIGEVRELRLESRLRAIEESFAHVAEQPRVLRGAVLEHAFAAFEREIEPGELGVALFELIDDAQRLQVVLEAAVFAHAFVERVLAGVSERRVPEVVREADRLGERLVDVERARDGAPDLRDFERMRDARAVQIAFVIHEDLGLVDEAAKRIRMDDAVAIALKLGAKTRWRLGKTPAATLFVDRGVRRERLVHVLPAAHAQRFAQRCVVVVARDHGLADRLEQHEPDASGRHLLVDLHLLGQRRRRQRA